MTSYRTIRLHCDWPRCSRSFDSYISKIGEARREAEKEGWASPAGMDLCGPPDEYRRAIEYPLGDRSNGHASAGHLPQTKPAGRGQMHLSCSCGGWSHPTPLYSKYGLRSYWARHIREDVLGDKPVQRRDLPAGGVS